MNITIIGCGYVGLVSGTCFSEFGADVSCYDIDKDRIEKLSNGEIPIYEPCLDNLVKKNIKQGRLKFTSQIDNCVPESDLIFIAVGTPTRRGDGHADLQYVFKAIEDIAPYLNGYTLIVNKSTVPVGTAREVKKLIIEKNPKATFDVASNPEFLREGAAITDFMRPDRVVIGVESERASDLLRELYRPINLIEAPILFTNLESAELVKYASNAFLATKVTFINEIAALCEEVGADVHAVSKGMGLDGRIGRKFLHPGPGYGGSCLPKDTRALVRTAKEKGAQCEIVDTVIRVNEQQKIRMIEKICAACDDDVSGKNLTILGLTFKPETDDMRESPALTILPELIKKKANIIAYDPKGMDEAKKIFLNDVQFKDDPYEAIKKSDAVIIMTEWNIFRGMNLKKIKKLMRGNKFIDLKNIYEPSEMKAAGFEYFCVGRS